MLRTLSFSAVTIEELENPRPHYRVDVRGTVTAMSGSSDHTAGLLPEEVVMTVRLSTDIGSDLTTIKKAACERALILLDTLVKAHIGASKPGTRPAAKADAIDIDA